MSKYLDKPIRVKFSGGRESSGILKGFDQLLNLVLDNTTEHLRGMHSTEAFGQGAFIYTCSLLVCEGVTGHYLGVVHCGIFTSE